MDGLRNYGEFNSIGCPIVIIKLFFSEILINYTD